MSEPNSTDLRRQGSGSAGVKWTPEQLAQMGYRVDQLSGVTEDGDLTRSIQGLAKRRRSLIIKASISIASSMVAGRGHSRAPLLADLATVADEAVALATHIADRLLPGLSAGRASCAARPQAPA
jgi:hypothetical protein